MTKFILNNQPISTDSPRGMTLLDFIRYEENLVGTKIGCREGDCGACTVLSGELKNGKVEYKSLTSCITPLGNAEGKHIVSIEGLNMEELSPVQQAMVDENGTQCGFCTVGFIVSLSGSCLSPNKQTPQSVTDCVDGNICRCTGYKSIERAAEKISHSLQQKTETDSVKWLEENKFIPNYFSSIPEKLKAINSVHPQAKNSIVVGGGTDLYVQKHDQMEDAEVDLVSDQKELKGIHIRDGKFLIGASVTAAELMESDLLLNAIPNLTKFLKLISSTPIRNIGTVAGNFVNASPIGDLTAFFIALNSSIVLRNSTNNERTILLRDLYKGYKTLDKSKDEIITQLTFDAPDKNTFFNFEKVSKRTYLDIASVNSAIQLKLNQDKIETVFLSAGGVGPTPLFLKTTCEFLAGKKLDQQILFDAVEIIQKEISPISDARGTETYKRLLLRQLFLAHFIELFPTKFNHELFI